MGNHEGMNQLSLMTGFERGTKRTVKQVFLEEMLAVVPVTVHGGQLGTRTWRLVLPRPVQPGTRRERGGAGGRQGRPCSVRGVTSQDS